MDRSIINRGRKKLCKSSSRTVAEKRLKDNERKRKQRQKLKENSEEYEKARAKEKVRYQQRKKSGELKLISEKSAREQRQQRKRWKKNTQSSRINKKLSATEECLRQDSPSCSYSLNNLVTSYIKKRNGRKCVLKNRSAANRKVKQLEAALDSAKKKAVKYKKRCERLLENRNRLSPWKHVDTILAKGAPEVKRQLLFGQALMKQLKDNAKLRKSHSEKFAFTKLVSGKILKKYKVAKLANEFSFRCTKSSTNDYKKAVRSITPHIKNTIVKFLEDDDNSSMAPGKDDCITKHKNRKQKRYLVDTMKNLHKKFTKTDSFSISYSTFCRAKPFWVVKPQASARDTCMCKKHANFQFLVTKLHMLKLIKYSQASNLISEIVCDATKKECMYEECSQCANKIITKMKADKDEGNNQDIFYYQWTTKKENRSDNKGKELVVQITTKEKVTCSIRDIIAVTEMQLPSYMKHCYNASHQQKALKNLRLNLKQNEVLLIIDFSENYECKYNREIQSAHFGASKNQITLHTAVLYYKENQTFDGMKQGIGCHSFATVSKSLRHDACAVWSHLCALLEEIRELLPNVNVIHFQSDGPTTQYRNKTNFFLFAHFSKVLGLQKATWNFSEAGHGKGPADGIGGVVKNLADQAVAHGTDIVNVGEFVKVVKDADIKVKIIEIKEADISKIDDIVPDNIKAIKNTMLLHQLVWDKNRRDQLRLYILSCFNCGTEPCLHFMAEPSVWYVTAKCKQKEVPSAVTEGQWVAVIYDEQWFPGVVDLKKNNILTINFMTRSKRNFCWPKQIDQQQVPVEEILCLIKDPPTPISTRYFCLTKDEHNYIDKLAASILI